MLDRFGLVAESRPSTISCRPGALRTSTQYFINSVIATLGAVVLLLVVSSLAGFALACAALSLSPAPLRRDPLLADDPGAGRAGAVLHAHHGSRSWSTRISD